jgi:hypothetical protein
MIVSLQQLLVLGKTLNTLMALLPVNVTKECWTHQMKPNNLSCRNVYAAMKVIKPETKTEVRHFYQTGLG